MSRTSPAGPAIYAAIVDLHHTGQLATRKGLVKATGYKQTIVDDHTRRMREQEKIRLTSRGHYEPIEPLREDRAVSLTALPSGLFKLEVGDEMLELTPREGRAVGALAAGIAMQFAGLGARPIDINIVDRTATVAGAANGRR